MKTQALRILFSLTMFAVLFCGAAASAFAKSDWTGFYGGISAGYTSAEADVTGSIKNEPYWNAGNVAQVPPILSKDITGEIFTGSLFAGGDYQVDSWVFGLQAKLTLGNMNNEKKSGPIEYTSNAGSFFTTSSKVESDWMFSLATRIGYTYKNSLLYAFGGLAASRFTHKFKFSDTFTAGIYDLVDSSRSENKLGWTAGAGYEYQIADGWGLMAEYTHYEFDDVFDSSYSLLATDPNSGISSGVDSFKADSFHIGIIKRF